MELGVILAIWGICAILNSVAFYFIELKRQNFISFKDLVCMALLILVPVVNTVLAILFAVVGTIITVEAFFNYLGSKMTFNLVWKDGKFQRVKE